MIREYHAVSVRFALISLLCVVLAPRSLRADATTTIAVIPLSGERRLALYGSPVASELTAALRNAGRDAVLISDVAVVPSRAWLVVDGRLVPSGKSVILELRIRDPEHAVDVARLSATATSLAAIDQTTTALAADLVRAIAAADAARAPAALPPPPPPDPTAPPPPPPPVDRRPTAIVTVRGRPLHDRAGQPLDLTALVHPSLTRLASRLGYRTVDGDRGDLMITAELVHVAAGFERDVPVGRGRVRVVVAAGDRTLYDRRVRTDTVVGSRGDRVDTVVRLVAAQVVDVVLPRIREQLAADR